MCPAGAGGQPVAGGWQGQGRASAQGKRAWSQSQSCPVADSHKYPYDQPSFVGRGRTNLSSEPAEKAGWAGPGFRMAGGPAGPRLLHSGQMLLSPKPKAGESPRVTCPWLVADGAPQYNLLSPGLRPAFQ